jgi:crossover junction endodeoxyribonuclease RusA
VLPFPPSVNRYYRHVGYRTLLSREGRAYRKTVCALLAGRVRQPLAIPLQAELHLYPPDRRRRDWDNFQKGV